MHHRHATDDAARTDDADHRPRRPGRRARAGRASAGPGWGSRRALALAVAVAATAAACTGTNDAKGSAATTAAGGTGTTVAGKGGGTAAGPSITKAQVEAALPKLEQYIAEVQAKTGVPGISVAVVKDDEVLLAKGYGVKEVGKPDKVDADTVFQLASVSKSVGSTVLSGLVGQGKVSWDDPVSTYLPDFTLKDPWVGQNVTIADMYAHRSGLPEHAGDLLEDLGYTRSEVIEKLRQEPLDPFRVTYHYGNFDITTAAEAASKAAGAPWEDLSKTVLYDPAGMTSTSSRFDDYMARSNRAVPHVEEDGTWVAKYQRQPDAQTAAGGVSSNATDMARWMRLQLGEGTLDGKQIIASEPLAESHLPEIIASPPRGPSSPAGFYGLGYNVGYDASAHLRLSHSGAFALGAGTNYVMLPADQLGIVVLTNGQPDGMSEAITATFVDILQKGEPTRDWLTTYANVFEEIAKESLSKTDFSKPPANPKTPIAASAITGSYTNPYYGPIRITEADGKVSLVMGPQDQSFEMKPFDGDVWSYETRGENASGLHAATFVVGPDGTATSVTLEHFDKNGLGTFTRQ